MKNTFRRTLAVLVMLLTLTMTCISPVAYGTGVEREEPMRFEFDGYSSITRSGNQVTCSGTTYAYQSAFLTARVFIEHRVNGNWELYSQEYATKTQVGSSVSASKVFSVASGNYYRTKTLHAYGSEVKYSYSSAIWVG